MNAPAKRSKRGTSWLTSTSGAFGAPASTTAFMAATRGEPEPKSEVKVTSGGPAMPRLPVARLLPGICFIVVSTLLPETDPVAHHELSSPQPLLRLPEVSRVHATAQRPAAVTP